MSGVYLINLLYVFIIIIILLIILILVVPSDLSFLIAVDGPSLETELNFRVLSGLMRGTMIFGSEGSSFKLLLATIPVYRSVQEERERKKEKKPSPRAPQENLSLFKKLYNPFVRLSRVVLRHTRVKELDCSIDVGLSDPVLTGMVCGVCYPLWETIYPFVPNGTFSISPVFIEEVFNASLKGSLSLRIALILVPLLRLFTKKEFRMLRKR